MSENAIDFDLIDDVASQLDLRAPNHEALKSIAYAVHSHYATGKDAPFEGVADVATGVGKTYVMAAAIEYFAALGHKHFAIIAPGSTILNKTIRNFTKGDPKSLLPGMSVALEVITAETFDSPAVAHAMENPDACKLYIFTVQSLTKPTTKQGRRTHDFRESLGDGFYSKLAEESDLIIFADEHHTYYGPAFSEAVRGLHPYALIGLTATPHKKTPTEQIIFRYPLAAAIADRYVKTPVVVGRRDDRTDDKTKLSDGAHLLELKRRAVEQYATENGIEPVNPVMLVIAQTIKEAEEYAAILESPAFMDGRYIGRVLTVHSDQTEEALAELDKIERAESPYSIIVSVGMLKEGWDVKNVYVIASMRASVSEILTEQTLGRGLRLPFGSYTGIEMLDTLEVVAHESYQTLLRRADALKEQLVDYRTLQARDEAGVGSTTITVPVTPVITVAGAETPSGSQSSRLGLPPVEEAQQPGGITIAAFDDRSAAIGDQVEKLETVVEARSDLPDVAVPVIQMTPVKGQFSLDVIDPELFRALGVQHAADPDALLLRTVISAEVEGGDHRRVKMVTRTAEDKVTGATVNVPLAESVEAVRRELKASEEVPARKAEAVLLDRLLDAYVAGLGDKAEEVLSGFRHRAIATFRKVLREAQRDLEAKPEYGELVRLAPLKRNRVSRPETSKHLAGIFRRGVGYEGWKKSYFPQVWFDSEPEFRFARVVDDADDVAFWVRLVRDDIPIMWTSAGNHYNPDFLVLLKDGTRVLAEVKADRMVKVDEVREKKTAAKRWTRKVSAEAEGEWEYLLVTPDDIKLSKGSWPALRASAR